MADRRLVHRRRGEVAFGFMGLLGGFLPTGFSRRAAGLYSAVRSKFILLEALTGSRAWPGPPLFSVLSPTMAGLRKWLRVFQVLDQLDILVARADDAQLERNAA